MQNTGTENHAQRAEQCSEVERFPLKIQKSMNWEVSSTDVRSRTFFKGEKQSSVIPEVE